MNEHLFKKGNPGGPGRKKGVPIFSTVLSKWCAAHGDKMLLDIAEGRGDVVFRNHRSRTWAIEMIYNYGRGKPPQPVDVTSDGQTIRDAIASALGRRTDQRAPENGP